MAATIAAPSASSPTGAGTAARCPRALVVERIRALVGEGFGEVVLTGVDVTSYGPDLPGAPTLGLLVERILRHVPDLPRLRLSSLDCIEIDPRLEEIVAHEPRFMPHLHMSFQAGDDMILKRMKRRHSRAQAIETVAAPQGEAAGAGDRRRPHRRLPDRKRAMHENSLRLVDECDIVMGHIFPFSPKRGTPAARCRLCPRRSSRPARPAAARGVRAAQGGVARGLVGTVQRCWSRRTARAIAENFAPVELAEIREFPRRGDRAVSHHRRHGDTLIGVPA
jgi:threonylcarbamoyladenosine tRNA methylthiotransferase MtaB